MTVLLLSAACSADRDLDRVVTVATPDDVLERQAAAAAAAAAHADDLACRIGAAIAYHATFLDGPHCGNADRDQVEREFARTACLKAWADCSHPPPGSVGCATAELDCVAYTRAIDPEIVSASAAGPACVPQLAVAPRPGTPKAVLAEALAKVSRDLAVARAQLAALGR